MPFPDPTCCLWLTSLDWLFLTAKMAICYFPVETTSTTTPHFPQYTLFASKIFQFSWKLQSSLRLTPPPPPWEELEGAHRREPNNIPVAAIFFFPRKLTFGFDQSNFRTWLEMFPKFIRFSSQKWRRLWGVFGSTRGIVRLGFRSLKPKCEFWCLKVRFRIIMKIAVNILYLL